jgi:predicted transcriptional regulator
LREIIDLTKEPFFAILRRWARHRRDFFPQWRLSLATEPPNSSTLLPLTASLVAAYVAKNPVPAGALPQLIESVYKTLTQLGETGEAAQNAPKPAVPVRRSIFPDYIICLEDGRKLKMLKRYLRTRYKLSPEDYRARWGLPADYPLVAPNYAARRSEFAKRIGLGRRPSKARRRKGA